MAAKRKGATSPVRGVVAARARDPLLDLSARSHRLIEVDLDSIAAHPEQPRQQIDTAGLEELAHSIERHGLLQPIVVRADGDGYVLIAGQRRLLAHRRLGRPRIAALLVEGAADELALIENLQREDLAPLDEATAVAGLKDRHGYSLDELARVLAKAKSTLSELLSLNGLPERLQADIRASKRPVAKSLLIEIARLPDEAAQLAFWQQLQADPSATVRYARSVKRSSTAPLPVATVGLQRSGSRLLEGLAALDASAMEIRPELRDLLLALRRRLDELLVR